MFSVWDFVVCVLYQYPKNYTAHGIHLNYYKLSYSLFESSPQEHSKPDDNVFELICQSNRYEIN